MKVLKDTSIEGQMFVMEDVFAFASQAVCKNKKELLASGSDEIPTIMALAEKALKWQDSDEEVEVDVAEWVKEELPDVMSTIKQYLSELKEVGIEVCKGGLAVGVAAMTKWAGGLEGRSWKAGVPKEATYQQLVSKSETLLAPSTAEKITDSFGILQKDLPISLVSCL